MIKLHFFHCAANNKIQAFCTINKVCFYSQLQSPVIVCIAIITSNVGNCGDHLQKYSKLNETRICASFCQGIWIFSLNLELERALFYVKKFPSWNNTYFTYYLSYIVAGTDLIVSRFKASIPHLSIDFRKFVLITCISKRFCYFSRFICHVREAIDHYQWNLKFTGPIWRTSKSQETNPLEKFFMANQFDLIDLSCCEKCH